MILLVPCLLVPVYGEKKGWNLREVPVAEVAEQPARNPNLDGVDDAIRDLESVVSEGGK
jgi:hypothetical protein